MKKGRIRPCIIEKAVRKDDVVARIEARQRERRHLDLEQGQDLLEIDSSGRALIAGQPVADGELERRVVAAAREPLTSSKLACKMANHLGTSRKKPGSKLDVLSAVGE